MIIIKDDSVKLKAITPGLALMFYIIELCHRDETSKSLQPKDLIITSINDGEHLPNSKHYKNEAFDMRSKSFKMTNKEFYRFAIESELNARCDGKDKFTVLLENIGEGNEHFHFQVKKGMSYP